MKTLKTLAIALSFLGLSNTFAQEKQPLIDFDPQFNYLEAGIIDDGTTRLRSYTTNNVHMGDMTFQHAGFHEVYDFEGLYSRNGLWLGKKDSFLSAGIAQSFTEEGALSTRAGLHTEKLPFGLYGFFDVEADVKGIAKNEKLNPGFTLFAGKDIQGFGKKPLSIWYFSAGNFNSMDTMFNEIQLNQDLGKGWGVGVRAELYELDTKNPVLNANVNYTF